MVTRSAGGSIVLSVSDGPAGELTPALTPALHPSAGGGSFNLSGDQCL
jgi:hypothetical protein